MAVCRAGSDFRPDLLPDVAPNQGDILSHHAVSVDAALEQFMEHSPLDGSMRSQPFTNEVNTPPESETGENLVVLKCFCGKYVPRPANNGDRYFRSKWLQKLFNLLNHPAD